MRIRKARMEDVSGIAHVHVDAWLETYRGIVPDDYLNRLSYEKRMELWKKNITTFEVFVAEKRESEEIVGFLSWGKSQTHPEYIAELYSIYLRKNEQGQGTGQQLWEAMIADFASKDIHSFIVKVLEENPACRFYEARDAKKIETLTVKISGKSLRESVYGWKVTK